MPGLRGFDERNLRLMRTFYEEWSVLINENDADSSIKLIWNSRIPNSNLLSFDKFLSIGFTHHRVILTKVKDLNERVFYINKCAVEHLS